MPDHESRIAQLEIKARAAEIAAEYGLTVAELLEEAKAILRFYDRHGRWPRDEEPCP